MVLEKLAKAKFNIYELSAFLRAACGVRPHSVSQNHPPEKNDKSIQIGHGHRAPIQRRALRVAGQPIRQRHGQRRVRSRSFRHQQFFRPAERADKNHAAADRKAKQIFLKTQGNLFLRRFGQRHVAFPAFIFQLDVFQRDGAPARVQVRQRLEF